MIISQIKKQVSIHLVFVKVDFTEDIFHLTIKLNLFLEVVQRHLV